MASDKYPVMDVCVCVCVCMNLYIMARMKRDDLINLFLDPHIHQNIESSNRCEIRPPRPP